MFQRRVGSMDSRSKLSGIAVQLCLVLIIASVLFVAPVAASHAFADGDVTHIVKPGESLSTIAAQYGISVTTLARYNGIYNINLLRVGQSLQIPSATVAPAPAPAQPEPTKVPVQNTVVQPNNTPVSEPAPNNTPEPASNNTPEPVSTPTPYIVDRNFPTPTPTRIIPTRVPPVSTTRTHIVAAADTLWSIANLYGTTPTAIKARNGLTKNTIYRGQRLIIP